MSTTKRAKLCPVVQNDKNGLLDCGKIYAGGGSKLILLKVIPLKCVL